MISHHKYSPSSLNRRKLCPYSVHEVEYPDKESPSALEGTLLHAAIFNDDIKKTLNEEQQLLVNMAYEFYIKKLKDDISFIEETISVSYNNKELYSGTPDVVIIRWNQKTDFKKAIVIDWKFGFLEVEEPKNNLQLAAYAAAVMRHYSMKICDTYIFQPRVSKKTKKYTFTNSEGIIKYITKIIEECEKPSPKCNPGEDQCRFCKLKDNMACPALKNELQTIDKTINLPELNDIELVALYERAKVVSKFIKAIEDETKLRINEKGYCGNKICKESSGGYSLNDITKIYAKVKHIIKKEDFLNICSVSDIALKELYCYNRVELKKKDAELEYIYTLGELRVPKEKRKTIVNKEE